MLCFYNRLHREAFKLYEKKIRDGIPHRKCHDQIIISLKKFNHSWPLIGRLPEKSLVLNLLSCVNKDVIIREKLVKILFNS